MRTFEFYIDGEFGPAEGERRFESLNPAISSGYGREGGIDALRDYTETKALMINATGEPVADPFVMH